MPDDPRDSTEIKDTDIIFDCPHCGKSLAIDYRGAGLTIPCTDCGRTVEVPIPAGMDITDIDSSDEDQEMQILNLRRLLSESEYRIDQIRNELDDVGSRRDVLEREHSANVARQPRVREKLDELRVSLRAAVEAVEDIGRAIGD